MADIDGACILSINNSYLKNEIKIQSNITRKKILNCILNSILILI